MGGPLVKINGRNIAEPINYVEDPCINIKSELMEAEPIRRKFFNINNNKMVTLQIVPDRTTKNRNVDDLARALHELYSEYIDRIDITNLSYRVADYFAFEIILTNATVQFFMTVPEKW
jgi:hypothetical protein